jgi:curli production assembly/transport component CsgG
MVAFICTGGCSPWTSIKGVERATVGYTTAIHPSLISLPEPEEKIVVAVYKFRDQTGQYKTSGTATTFSTAVSQGATSMLNKALEDSGWFLPIEREGMNNLMNERKIIRSTRLQYNSANGNEATDDLPPLLYAGVLLEGGIISYDTNVITGGLGARYFGAGGHGKIQKDQVTVYLRLVSVQTGQILKTVSTTKSILSREVDFGLYRFVREKRLLEIESGFTTNEPASMCVLEAVEKAVFDLIIEGVREGIWSLAKPEDMNAPIIQKYLKEKMRAESAPSIVVEDRNAPTMERGVETASVDRHENEMVYKGMQSYKLCLANPSN